MDLEKKSKELDLAIEKKRRQLLAGEISGNIIESLDPLVQEIATIKESMSTDTIQSTDALITKLDELKDTLKNHEVTIEI